VTRGRHRRRAACNRHRDCNQTLERRPLLGLGGLRRLHKGGFGDPLTLLRALLRGFQGDERCGERYGVPGRCFFERRD
jgi:hypothetical protein